MLSLSKNLEVKFKEGGRFQRKLRKTNLSHSEPGPSFKVNWHQSFKLGILFIKRYARKGSKFYCKA